MTAFVACITGSGTRRMLSTVNYTPLSSRLFIQEDLLCILVRGLCNFPARFIVMIEEESVYFPLFHPVIYVFAVNICTECVY